MHKFHYAVNVTLPQGKHYKVRNMTDPDFVVEETTLGKIVDTLPHACLQT